MISFNDAGRIRVNSIHPGIITGTTLVGSASPELVQSSSAAISTQRPGTTKMCTDLVLFLVCDGSDFNTGTGIPIVGGYASGATKWMLRKLHARLTES